MGAAPERSLWASDSTASRPRSPWHCDRRSSVVDRVSTPSPPVPPAPDGEDLRGLARGVRQLFELAAQTLGEEAGPSGLARRVTGHLGCELTEVVLVSERFPSWEHVNVQRGRRSEERRVGKECR